MYILETILQVFRDARRSFVKSKTILQVSNSWSLQILKDECQIIAAQDFVK